MTNLQDLLRTADPLTEQPALDDGQVELIRRRVLAEVSREPPAWRLRALALAATVVAALALGFLVGQRLSGGRETRARLDIPPEFRAPIVAPQPPLDSARRQVQFATPGGTRIIWVIDPDFDW
jgi:hypothetical protein